MRVKRCRARASLSLAAIVLMQLAYLAGCVDGMTPDCSNAAAQCGPFLDGAAFDATEAQVLKESGGPDTGADADSAVPDANDLDADADAGDGG